MAVDVCFGRVLGFDNYARLVACAPVKSPVKSKPKITERALANASEAVRRLNPHLYTPGNTSHLAEPGKRMRQSTKPELNKLETQWLAQLKAFMPHAIIRSQSLRFRLGNGIWYKPDFTVSWPEIENRNRAYEVKGPKAWRGGFENLKVAAALWPEIQWFLVWKEDGRWREQEVLS